MKRLKKVLVGLFLGMLLIAVSLSSYAATVELNLKNFGMLKYLCIGAGVVLILLVLLISYKTDKSHENEDD